MSYASFDELVQGFKKESLDAKRLENKQIKKPTASEAKLICERINLKLGEIWGKEDRQNKKIDELMGEARAVTNKIRDLCDDISLGRLNAKDGAYQIRILLG